MCSKSMYYARKINSRWMQGSSSCWGNQVNRRTLSSGEAFAALKPFFFAVHPDLFGQYPKEREVNENSLKRLNEYIESATNNMPGELSFLGKYNTRSQPHLTFYLRQNERREQNRQAAQIRSIGNVDNRMNGSFQTVKIDLSQRDVRSTVHSILEKCNLPTSYLDSLPTPQPQTDDPSSRYRFTPAEPAYSDYREQAERDISEKKVVQDDLVTWLSKNVDDAREKLQNAIPVREEITRLKETLCQNLQLNDIIWDCGWGTKHFRGSLESLQSLASHHPDTMKILNGRTVIFGAATGVSMNGDVVLYTGEVRSNWLDVIRNIKQHDQRILTIPSFQKALSRTLKDIKVVHRKFEPKKLADSYEIQLRKLITSLGDYTGRQQYPADWPDKLSHLELVVETDAGPLMVSPTGQIIVPSSCPPFLLVKFITEHMDEASEKLAKYSEQKYEERELHEACIMALGLATFEKADNVTPNLMIDCCRRLLAQSTTLSPLLNGTHLLVTTYYSLLTEGEICIPWNWR